MKRNWKKKELAVLYLLAVGALEDSRACLTRAIFIFLFFSLYIQPKKSLTNGFYWFEE